MIQQLFGDWASAVSTESFQVGFKCSDNNNIIEVNSHVVNYSKVISSYLDNINPEEYNPKEDIFPLNNVNTSTFQKIVEYCQQKLDSENNQGNFENSQSNFEDYQKTFLDKFFKGKTDDEELFNLILAANYLDIPCLLDLTCKKVADEIKKCSTPEEIRERFDIENDFTPEEEEEIRKENAWMEDINENESDKNN